MRNLTKILFWAPLTLTLLSSGANADVLTLANGDKITGTIRTADSSQIIFSSSFGELTIPRKQIVSVDSSASAGEDTLPVQKAEVASSNVETAAPVAPENDPAAPEAVEKEPQWVIDYRNFLNNNLPEGWQFRLRGGMEYRETTSSVFTTYIGFDIKKEWELDKFYMTLYYNYTNETSVADVTSTTLDKYGADTKYRHDFNKNNTWYVQNILNYKKDMVKGIRDQVDEAVTFGYRFDLKRYNLIIDIGPGPAVRYINASNFDTKWVCMAILAEDITWKINKVLRFEQNGYMGFNVQEPSQYSAYLKLALITEVTEVMNIALRYSYDYDAINASTAQKTEQSLILSFEFPFNWK